MNDGYFQKLGLPVTLCDHFVADCEALKSIRVDLCVLSPAAHADILSKISRDRSDYRPFIAPLCDGVS